MLPTWAEAPFDEASALVVIKRAIRARIEASWRWETAFGFRHDL